MSIYKFTCTKFPKFRWHFSKKVYSLTARKLQQNTLRIRSNIVSRREWLIFDVSITCSGRFGGFDSFFPVVPFRWFCFGVLDFTTCRLLPLWSVFHSDLKLTDLQKRSRKPLLIFLKRERCFSFPAYSLREIHNLFRSSSMSCGSQSDLVVRMFWLNISAELTYVGLSQIPHVNRWKSKMANALKKELRPVNFKSCFGLAPESFLECSRWRAMFYCLQVPLILIGICCVWLPLVKPTVSNTGKSNNFF